MVPVADAQSDGAALDCGVERNGHVHGRRGLRLGSGAASGLAGGPAAERLAEVGAAPAHATEDLAEDFLCLRGIHVEIAIAGKAAAAEVEAAVAPVAGLGAGETKAVVLSALGLVAEHVVGVLNLLEARLGLLVPGVAIGVIFPAPGCGRPS